MNTIGVLLLAAATATSGGMIGKPHVGGKRLFLRHHAVMNGPPPATGMVGGPGMMGGPGMAAPGACGFGHPGCAGGPACAGAGAGAMGPGAARRFPNVRSQLFFVDPPGMKVGWQTAAGNGERVYLPSQLTVPARYNFVQGYIYRLKLTDIPGDPGLVLYPTVEVAPSTPATDAYLTHNPIPVQFTREDFDQVKAGNFVTKVIYLPDPKYQELAVAGVETLVSTRLEPGVDPIREADKRGTILMIVRLGGIDLEMPSGVGGTVIQEGTVYGNSNVFDEVGEPAMMPSDAVYPSDETAPFAPTPPTDSIFPSGPADTGPGMAIPDAEAEPLAPSPAPVSPASPTLAPEAASELPEPAAEDEPAGLDLDEEESELPEAPPAVPGLGDLPPPVSAPSLGELPLGSDSSGPRF